MVTASQTARADVCVFSPPLTDAPQAVLNFYDRDTDNRTRQNDTDRLHDYLRTGFGQLNIGVLFPQQDETAWGRVVEFQRREEARCLCGGTPCLRCNCAGRAVRVLGSVSWRLCAGQGTC